MKTAFEIAMEKDSGYVPINLTREQMIACIKGAEWGGSWEKMDKCRGYGTYDDLSGWHWNDLSRLTDAELIHLYYVFFEV